MTVESKAMGNFASEDGTNVQVPCCLAATTYEIYDNFKQILETNNIKFYEHRLAKGHSIQLPSPAQKIKLLEALSVLVKTKPEFVLGMGRLSEDVLPLIRVHFDLLPPLTDDQLKERAKLKKNEESIELNRIEQFAKMDWRLAKAMRAFLIECRTAHLGNALEDVDKRRFDGVVADIVEVIEKMDAAVDWTTE